jgi:hypothetical protein
MQQASHVRQRNKYIYSEKFSFFIYTSVHILRPFDVINES